MKAERQPTAPPETPPSPMTQLGAVGCSLQRSVRLLADCLDEGDRYSKELGLPIHTAMVNCDDLRNVVNAVKAVFDDGWSAVCPFCRRTLPASNYTEVQWRIKAHEWRGKICDGSSMIVK